MPSPPADERPAQRRRRLRLAAWLFLALAVIMALTWGWSTYRRVERLRAQAGLLLGAMEDPGAAGHALRALRADAAHLQRQARPLLWLCGRLGWLPRLGPTLAAAPPLAAVADDLLASAEAAWPALEPSLAAYAQEKDLAATLAALYPAIAAHEEELAEAAERARAAEERLAAVDASRLPARLGRPLIQAQAAMPLLVSVLEALPLVPQLLGGEERTYLLLAQNNDELRPTGGFISSIGMLTFRDGVPGELDMGDSYRVENWGVPHPPPPEAFGRHMDIELWTTRDANWWPDFPTSARAVATMYELNQGQRVDGVIAIDMLGAARLLEALTPLTLEDGRVVGRGEVMEALREGYSMPEEAMITDGEVITADRPFHTVEIVIEYSQQYGRAWFDAVSLASLAAPERELVRNGDFSEAAAAGLPAFWQADGLGPQDGLTDECAYVGSHSLRIEGDSERDKSVRQRIAISGETGDQLRVFAVSRVEGGDYRAGPHRLVVRLLGDGEPQTVAIRFPNMAHDWASAGAGAIQAEWLAHRKDVVSELAGAALGRIAGSPADVAWPHLLAETRALLEERHLQAYSAEHRAQALLDERGWGGRMPEGDGDYLLVTESNVGYNKVSANLRQEIAYRVDLTDRSAPRAVLTVTYRNESKPSPLACDKFRQHVTDYEVLSHGCYWGYLRVYAPPGSLLLAASGGDEEAVQQQEARRAVFATAVMLHPGEEREVRFEYLLPPTVVRNDSYALLVQKQAGTAAHPLVVELRGVEAVVDKDGVAHAEGLVTTDLRVDRRFVARLR